MEDESDEMLCLLRHFNDRPIRDPRLWQEAVMPELAAFRPRAMRTQRPYYLHMDAHSSIAFAA